MTQEELLRLLDDCKEDSANYTKSVNEFIECLWTEQNLLLPNMTTEMVGAILNGPKASLQWCAEMAAIFYEIGRRQGIKEAEIEMLKRMELK